MFADAKSSTRNCIVPTDQVVLPRRYPPPIPLPRVLPPPNATASSLRPPAGPFDSPSIPDAPEPDSATHLDDAPPMVPGHVRPQPGNGVPACCPRTKTRFLVVVAGQDACGRVRD